MTSFDRDIVRGCIEPVEPKAPAKPLWQMDVRQRLDLRPGRVDPISGLLWAAIYGSESEREFIARVEQHIDELRRAVAVIKAEAK